MNAHNIPSTFDSTSSLQPQNYENTEEPRIEIIENEVVVLEATAHDITTAFGSSLPQPQNYENTEEPMVEITIENEVDDVTTDEPQNSLKTKRKKNVSIII